MSNILNTYQVQSIKIYCLSACQSVRVSVSLSIRKSDYVSAFDTVFTWCHAKLKLAPYHRTLLLHSSNEHTQPVDKKSLISGEITLKS